MAKCKYNESFPMAAEGYARRGLTDEQIASNLNISVDTFYQYVKRFPEFSEALKRGKAPVDIQVENALLKRALGYKYKETTREACPDSDGEGSKLKVTKVVTKEVSPDVTAQIFWLKNRRPDLWKDRTDNNHSIDLTQPIKFIVDKDDAQA